MKQAYEEKGHVGRCNSHFTGNSCMKIEEVEEHIATNGPRRTKIVQYFACQKFVEMAPKDRFQELKNKGYCLQCLFSGVSKEKGKHHDGEMC